MNKFPNTAAVTEWTGRTLAGIRSCLAGIIAFIVILCASASWSSEVTGSVSKVENSSTAFNFGDPATFQYASTEEKQILRGIAETEFSLAHLSSYERELAEDALRSSGVEVYDACPVDMDVAGRFGALFVRKKLHEKTRFDPDLGILEIPSEESEDAEPPAWKRGHRDFTEYPYPLGEARLVPKIIPVNLSSVRVVERSESNVTYVAKPSALLFEKMRPEDRILNADQLSVRFDVDPSARRITRLTLDLDESVKVYRAIRISNLKFEYVFEDDETIGRNVLTRVHHAMKGRIAWVLRPNFVLTTELTYGDCIGAQTESSYLYSAIDGIRALK